MSRFPALDTLLGISAEDAPVIVDAPAPKAEEPKADASAIAAASADGAKAERTRWAKVLSDDSSQGRMTAAITLLGETELSHESITAMLPKMGKDTVTASEQAKVEPTAPKVDPLTASTPKVELGANNNDGSPKSEDSDPAKFWGSVTADSKLAEGGKPKFAMRG